MAGAAFGGGIGGKLTVVALSAAFSLYLCEALSTGLAIPDRIRYREHYVLRAAADRAGLPFDERTAMEYVDAHEGRAPAIHAYVPPAAVLQAGFTTAAGEPLQPIGGRANRWVVPNCMEEGRYTKVHTDRYGFNNPDDVWEREGDLDILILGDSYAHGYCIAQGSDVASRLRERGLSVVTLGHGGHGPLSELATLIEYGAMRRPRAVVWLYFQGNDAVDLEAEKRSSVLPRYLDQGLSQGLAAQQSHIDELYDAFVHELKAEHERQHDSIVQRILGALKFRSLRTLVQAATQKAPETISLDVETVERVLMRARDIVSAQGGRLYFVYLTDHSLMNRDKAALLRIASSLGIATLDMEETMRAHPDRPSLSPNRSMAGHLSSEGYELLASRIADLVDRPHEAASAP